jgi:tetraprenyl-beta-curcumene synthase
MSSAENIPRSRILPVTEPAGRGGRALAERWLTVRAAVALVLANARYWTTVARPAGVQLARWEKAARAIADPELRALALGELREERFNPQLAATLATLAPRSRREIVVEAIVALQVLYDYLDVLDEQPNFDGEWLVRTFTDAVAVGAAAAPRKIIEKPRYDDAGYLDDLARAVVVALASLPTCDAIAQVARAAAVRCAQAQTLNHSVPTLGSAHAEEWATEEARGTGLGWQEYLAGASASVLGLHALIAAAADPATTYDDAVAIDAAYLAIGALTMLDSVVDYDDDLHDGRPGYLQYYDSPEQMTGRLEWIAREARARAGSAPHGAHHVMTLVGVAAYYLSDPGVRTDFARPIAAGVRAELGPPITPTLWLMRSWRLAKRLRSLRTSAAGQGR